MTNIHTFKIHQTHHNLIMLISCEFFPMFSTQQSAFRVLCVKCVESNDKTTRFFSVVREDKENENKSNYADLIVAICDTFKFLHEKLLQLNWKFWWSRTREFIKFNFAVCFKFYMFVIWACFWLFCLFYGKFPSAY